MKRESRPCHLYVFVHPYRYTVHESKWDFCLWTGKKCKKDANARALSQSDFAKQSGSHTPPYPRMNRFYTSFSFLSFPTFFLVSEAFRMMMGVTRVVFRRPGPWTGSRSVMLKSSRFAIGYVGVLLLSSGSRLVVRSFCPICDWSRGHHVKPLLICSGHR